MNFASDNWAGASEPVMAALAEAARWGGPAYGGDALTRAVERRFSELFEREVTVFLVATGTAANALGLSAYARPGGVVFCHAQAHVLVDEAGAAEFFGGVKVVGLDGDRGRVSPETLAEAMARFPAGNVHHGQPVAVSLTEITELGAAYRPDEIAALAEVARSRGVAVHMDGARFAGAVAALNATPADLTWRAGVDVLSFGGTKNGCIAAEAVVFFDPAQARDFGLARQRAGQGFSKNWFIAAQFDAYLKDGHWLDLARRANAMAARLADAIAASGKARLAWWPDANEVFAILTRDTDNRLRAAGAVYYPWSASGLPFENDERAGEVMVRLVTSFQTRTEDIDRFAGLLAKGRYEMPD
jgi:threonine aldolase